jgi:pyridoxal phosphate enzyme (YggS family)
LFSALTNLFFLAVDLDVNFAQVRERIAAACARAGREPGAVALLAATKGVPPELVSAAADLGQVLFGENRVQEAKVKISACPSRLRWHMIGHLQSNKCRDAVALFEMVQSVDSLGLAQELDKWAEKQGKTLPVLLEVNIAGEGTKFGYRPETLLAQLPALNALRRLELHGLMAVPPWTPEPEKARPLFRQLRALKGRCEEVLGAPLPQLSMGMSHDFEVAIEEGATLVRLGTVLFGPRAQHRRTSAAENVPGP